MAKHTDLLAARAKKLGAGRAPTPPSNLERSDTSTFAAPQRAAPGGRRVTTVSFYEADRARIKAIRRALEDLDEAGGSHLDDSKVIRLALRAVEVNGPALLAALRSLHADDGRRQRRTIK